MNLSNRFWNSVKECFFWDWIVSILTLLYKSGKRMNFSHKSRSDCNVCSMSLSIINPFSDTLAFFMFLLKCDFANANAVIKAHNDFRKMRKTYKNHPEEDTLSLLPGHSRLIIIDRFLLRKKR